jgi:signal peptidase I
MGRAICSQATETIQAVGECNKAESFGSNHSNRWVYASPVALPRRIGAGRSTVRRGQDPEPLYSRTCDQTTPSVTRRPALGCLLEIVETLVLTLLIFWVIQSFVAQPYRVEQQSMEATLEPDQYVLVDKMTPRFDTYKRGDIVVFTPPPGWASGTAGTPFIKRVIGVGDDVVEIHDGKVFVNGTELVEPYIFKEADGVPQETQDDLQQTRWVVPKGELFLMGDHRGSSADSRAFGTVAVDKVIGRAWLRYWPLNTLQIIPTPTHPELQTAAP